MRHNKNNHDVQKSGRRSTHQWENQWGRQQDSQSRSEGRQGNGSRWGSESREYDQQGYEPGFSSSYAPRPSGTSYYPGTGERNYSMGQSYSEQSYGRPYLSDFDRADRYSAQNSRPWSSSEQHGLGREQYGQSYGQNNQSYEEGRSGRQLGKGPKGYQRSDERIREDVCESLSYRSGIDASEVEVNVSEGVVTLSGTADSRQMKRMIEDCVENVSGVKDVKNEIKVQSSASGTLTSSRSGETGSKMSQSIKNSGSSSRHAQ